MGRLFVERVEGPKIFKCKCCKVDSASPDDIISKDFHGRFGRAYLFRNVVNICLGPTEERHLLSGLHIEKAYEESEKYKEGLYILEKERMVKDG